MFCLRKVPIFVGACLLLFCDGVLTKRNYENYQIYEITPQTILQHQWLHQLSLSNGYDFLAFGRNLNQSSRVMVSPLNASALKTHLVEQNFDFKILIENVEQELQRQNRIVKHSRTKSTRNNRLNILENYYTHEEINKHLEQLAKDYPGRVHLKTFGRTYERRDLKIVTITNGDGRSNKNVILIDAGIHAREWITPSTALYIIDELLDNFSENEELLRDYDWVIIPIVNADGYEYTHLEDRYWRKTRRPTNTSDCIGTDINRNFGYHWGLEDGSSSDPCSEIYHGEKPFSEFESQILRDIMWTYKRNLIYYLSLHSYGRDILLPWGYTSAVPDNFPQMMDIAEEGAFAILFAKNEIYSYGSSYSVIYATSGDSVDYAAGDVNVPIAMTMELPPGGAWGFEPSIEEIEEFVIETWIGIRAMAVSVTQQFSKQ